MRRHRGLSSRQGQVEIGDREREEVTCTSDVGDGWFGEAMHNTHELNSNN
jgi:hypothetical protein